MYISDFSCSLYTRYVQKSLFVPNQSQTLPDFAFGATETTKNHILSIEGVILPL